MLVRPFLTETGGADPKAGTTPFESARSVVPAVLGGFRPDPTRDRARTPWRPPF